MKWTEIEKTSEKITSNIKVNVLKIEWNCIKKVQGIFSRYLILKKEYKDIVYDNNPLTNNYNKKKVITRKNFIKL